MAQSSLTTTILRVFTVRRSRLWLIRTALLTVAGSGCGLLPPDHNKDAARSLTAQLAVFCPNNGMSWDRFGARADILHAAPDGGAVVRPPDIKPEEIVREQWVALNHLGHRTTVWMGELKPGVLYEGYSNRERPYSEGLVCMVHDSTLDRAGAMALTRNWGDHGKMVGGRRDADGVSHITHKAWVNMNTKNYYEAVEVLSLSDPGSAFIRSNYKFHVEQDDGNGG